MTTWKNIPGSLYLEAEIEVQFLSSGYHEPMSMYGGPDNLGHPEEGDDERLLSDVLLTVDGVTFKLPQDIAQRIFDEKQKEIYDAELDCEPQYED